MKAKNTVPRKGKQLESPKVEPSEQPVVQADEQPEVQTDEERKNDLLPWQQLIVALAEARLSLDGEQDVMCRMHERAIGICRFVEDACLVADDDNDAFSVKAMGELMQVAQEDIQVARWISAGKPLDPRFF